VLEGQLILPVRRLADDGLTAWQEVLTHGLGLIESLARPGVTDQSVELSAKRLAVLRLRTTG
jgi:hypothetical protein